VNTPSPVYDRHGVTVHHGDALTVLAALPAESIHAVVCDPPYSLGFMGRAWDTHDTPAAFQEWCRQWAVECLRVLTPGGHLLAFGGTRTGHRLAAGIEDAGFEIRDTITWLYGSGFPKSLDVSKAIDKRGGGAHLAGHIARAVKAARVSRGWTAARADDHFCGGSTNWTWYEGRKGVCRPPAPDDFARIAAEWPELEEVAALVAEAEREKIGEGYRIDRMDGSTPITRSSTGAYDITAPSTDAAREWAGWGTALKPASEPIVVARKPLSGTVAATVTEHGTGALNIGGCRTDPGRPVGGGGGGSSSGRRAGILGDAVPGNLSEPHTAGRWPTNVVLDEAAAAQLDAQSGTSKSPKPYVQQTREKGEVYGLGSLDDKHGKVSTHHGDSGGASRFFPVFRYEAKAPTAERPKIRGVAHPTVKPLDLMRWLVRLVTPPGGIVCDPFAGTGTTGHAARAEGFRAVLIELDDEHIPLIVSRLDGYRDATTAPVDEATGRPEPMDLLDLIAEDGEPA
jgi:DNA modification methylase